MMLCLLRHADAADVAITDAARQLSQKGRNQATAVGEYLRRRKMVVDLLITSHYVRARETARMVADLLSVAEPIEDPRLGCGMTPETGLQIVQESRHLENILIVGHQPDLGELAAFLLTEDESLVVQFSKAALLGIELNAVRKGAGALSFFVPVEMMG